MSKLKQPVISLEAHGTIGDSLTLKRRRGKDLAIRKPVPAYRRTLPQLYQRWDYQDGIAYWTTLTPAQKQTYKSNGAKHHMTGFAYFMRYYLKNLPHLVGKWHLDEGAGATAYDSSKSNNHGTVIGALWATGAIGSCLWFDGVDDHVHAPTTGLPIGNADRTVLLWVRLEAYPGAPQNNQAWLCNYGTPGVLNKNYSLFVTNLGRYQFSQWGATVIGATPLQLNRWYAIVLKSIGNDVTLYLDGTEDGSGTVTIDTPSGSTLYLGNHPAYNRATKGKIDEVKFYDEGLNLATIKHFSERRYP